MQHKNRRRRNKKKNQIIEHRNNVINPLGKKNIITRFVYQRKSLLSNIVVQPSLK